MSLRIPFDFSMKESRVRALFKEASETVSAIHHLPDSNLETAAFLTMLKGYQAAMSGYEYSPF